jgi:hypothetical protein
MTKPYTVVDKGIWKRNWGKARDAAYKMRDNGWTAAEASVETGISTQSIRMAAYRLGIPLIGKPGRAKYGMIKQHIYEALVGRETAKQLQARTGLTIRQIRKGCEYTKVKLLKE